MGYFMDEGLGYFMDEGHGLLHGGGGRVQEEAGTLFLLKGEAPVPIPIWY